MPEPQLVTRTPPRSATDGTVPIEGSASDTAVNNALMRPAVVPEDSYTAGHALPAVALRLILKTDAGFELPLVASPAAVAPLLGKSDHGVRDDCTAGRIPTLPRGGQTGAHYRIPVARLLDQLGIPYRIEPVNCGGAS